MKRLIQALAFAGLTLPGLVMAALPVGSKAPDFILPGALGGDAFQFHLQKALSSGPVVVYFYPKACLLSRGE